jgi:universal stress protein E
MNLKSILVVIDPKQQAQAALERALWLARSSGASLELLLCDYQSALESGHPFDQQARQQARDALLLQHQATLEELAAPLHSEGLQVSTCVRWGKARDEQIVQRAGETRPDLLIKATHNHGSWQRLFLSNSCWQLIRHSPVPLWLVHRQEWRGQRLCAALDPLHESDKPASLDQRLIATATELAERLQMQAHFVHSHAPLPQSLLFDNALLLDYPRYVQDSAARHRQAFEQLLAPYPIDTARCHLLEGYPEQSIPQFVREQQIDLLLMGAVSRSHLDSLLIGSSAERILEAVDCDLLVINQNMAQ